MQTIYKNETELFHDFPGDTRVWIYQANRILTDVESNEIESALKEFAKSWSSHGAALTADATVVHQRFVIFAVNPHMQGASGCSIDKSVALIRKFENDYALSFFDRTQILIKSNSVLQQLHFHDVSEKLKTDEIASEAMFYDNSITTLSQLQAHWLKPVKGSFLDR